jgi:hypothetical protein
MLLAAVLMTLSATALSHYWRLQQLNGSRDSLIGHLREVQQRVISESHPLVYGVRFSPGNTATATSVKYSVMKYNPGADLASTSDDTCTVDPDIVYTLPGGVFVKDASFDAAGSPVVLSKCPTLTAADRFLFFYARGTATGGTVTLYSPSLNQQRQVHVLALTARVDE